MTLPFDESEFDHLLQAVVGQTITAEQVARLEQILLSDAKARTDYCQLTEIDHLLTRCYHPNTPPPVVVLTPEKSQAGRAILIASSAISACLMLAVIVWSLSSAGLEDTTVAVPPPGVEPAVTEPRVVAATLDSSVDAVWGTSTDHRELADGSQWLTDQSIELQRGSASIELANGVRCVVADHALLRIDEQFNCFVDMGSLTFSVPDTATGFTVHTNSGSYQDLGTVFGVRASENGASETHVIKGLVRVKLGRHQETLRTGGAMRLSQTASTPQRIGFRADHFSQHLAYSVGIRRLPRTLQFWSQPLPSVVPDRSFTTHRDAWLLAERSDVRVDEALANRLRSFDSSSAVSSGARLCSYLLYFGHQDRGADKTISGSLTFGTPVAAVLTSRRALMSTDETFCAPSTNIELDGLLGSSRGADEPNDDIALSSDRMTLSFQLTANGFPNIDQLRILLYEPN